MKIVYSVLALLVATGAACSASGQSSDPKRCTILSDPARVAANKKYNIYDICVPVRAEYRSNGLDLPTELVTRSFGIPQGNVFLPNHSGVSLRPPPGPTHAHHVTCRAHRVIHSEINGPGRYLKHGARTPVSAREAKYEWVLKRKRGRNVRLVADLYYSTIGKQYLDQAIREGVCQPLDDLTKPNPARSSFSWIT